MNKKINFASDLGIKTGYMLKRIKSNANAILTVAILGATSLSWADYSAKDQLMLGQKVMSEDIELNGSKQKTLVSFWAAYDAESVVKNRILVNKYSNDSSVKVISVSLDKYKSLFDEEVKFGKINADEVVWLGADNKVARDFKLEPGQFEAFLIDENGTLLSVE